MSWFSDLVSGSQRDDGSRDSVDPAERARQLLEGVVSSARAAAEELDDLATRAETASRRVVEGVPAAEASEQRSALERLDRLHFALLQVAVQDEDPGEAGLEAAVEGVEEMADRLDGGG